MLAAEAKPLLLVLLPLLFLLLFGLAAARRLPSLFETKARSAAARPWRISAFLRSSTCARMYSRNPQARAHRLRHRANHQGTEPAMMALIGFVHRTARFMFQFCLNYRCYHRGVGKSRRNPRLDP